MSTSFAAPGRSGGEGEASGAGRLRVPLRDATLELAYRDSGSQAAAVTLVCLHAVGHDQGDYAGLATLPGIRMVSFDWPDHGASGCDPAPASAERYTEICEAFLEALDGSSGQRRYVLVGNSIGGAVALRIATGSRLTKQIAGLVLIDAGGLVPMGAKERAFCRLFSWAYGAAGRGGVAARVFPWWYSKLYHRLLAGPEAAERRGAIVAAGLERVPVLSQAWRSFAAPEASVIERCSEVRVASLVCWARSDPFNSLRASLPALQRLPASRLEVFEGGHAPHVEHPDRFREVLNDYLSTLRDQRSADGP